jgi:hypothetical protein
MRPTTPLLFALALSGTFVQAASPLDVLSDLAALPQRAIAFGLSRVLGFNETAVERVLKRDDAPIQPHEHAGAYHRPAPIPSGADLCACSRLDGRELGDGTRYQHGEPLRDAVGSGGRVGCNYLRAGSVSSSLFSPFPVVELTLWTLKRVQGLP